MLFCWLINVEDGRSRSCSWHNQSWRPEDELECVIGCWVDNRRSRYNVSFSSTNGRACDVKTLRPNGAEICTNALIRCNDKEVSFGEKYILDVDALLANSLRWVLRPKAVAKMAVIEWYRAIAP